MRAGKSAQFSGASKAPTCAAIAARGAAPPLSQCAGALVSKVLTRRTSFLRPVESAEAFLSPVSVTATVASAERFLSPSFSVRNWGKEKMFPKKNCSREFGMLELGAILGAGARIWLSREAVNCRLCARACGRARFSSPALTREMCLLLRSHPAPIRAVPAHPTKPATMMLEENNSIIHQSSNKAATFSKVSASGRVTRVLACSCCSVYADWPPPWV